MLEPNTHSAKDDNVQHLVIGGCTYEIHSIFGSNVKLEEIIAQRVRKEMDKELFDNIGEKTCFSANEERSCIGK